MHMCVYVSIIIADKRHIVRSVDAHLSQIVSKRDLMFTDIYKLIMVSHQF